MEWIRGITILFTLYGIYEYVKFYLRNREPALLAPLSWLILVLAYSIFKWIVGPDLRYYLTSVIFANAVLITGVILTTAALVLLRGVKKNGS